MAGIQVHSSAPINTNRSQTRDEPAHVPATTTATAVAPTPAAQPGAPAVPAPTSAASYAYTPPSPTRTTTLPALSNPPPPQPGQVPTPERGRMPTINTQPNYPAPIPASWTPNYRTTRPQGDLSHPPGYMQNSHASFDDRDLEPGNKTHTPSPTRGRGILDENPLTRNTDGSSSPIWDTAVGWAKEAGRKLSVVEGEIWKKVNGEK